jgi:hypothetical protein
VEALLNPLGCADERCELQILVGEFGEFDAALAALELVSKGATLLLFLFGERVSHF